MSKHKTGPELESIRRCVEWAVPQLNCGNMTKDGYWDYLVLMFGQISPDAFARELAEMLRAVTLERDHLQYMQQSYPNIWRELVREVVSGDFTDAAYAAELPARLAESDWFKRARAVLG